MTVTKTTVTKFVSTRSSGNASGETMNCRPGDLAYIARSEFSENIGRPVEVLCLGKQTSRGWSWFVRSQSLLAVSADGDGFRYATHLKVLDGDLRPISAPLAERARIEFDPVYVALGITR